MKRGKMKLPDGFTGSVEGLIYYKDKKSGKIYVRRSFEFVDHPGQKPFATAQKAIYALEPSEAYKKNLKDYLLEYNDLDENQDAPARSWANLYNKLMFAMQQKQGINLASITRTAITKQNLPCKTVKDAVEAGLLPVTRFYKRYTAQI